MAITKARLKSDADAGAVLTVYANLAAFPTTGPSIGDQAFNQDNNKIYVWNGNGWFSVATINQTPTWTSEPDASYVLSTNGSPTTITVAATDPDGFPITYGHTATGLGNIATISQSGGTFTITPSTNTDNGGTFTVTFTATDGVNQITKPNISFSLVFQVDFSNSTSLLLKASGTGNNAVVPTDLSANSHTPTVNGDIYQTTFSPYRAGGYSYMFDGNGDYLTAPTSTDFSFDGDFTIECFIYKRATGQMMIFDNISPGASGGSAGRFAGYIVNEKLAYYAAGTGTVNASASNVISLNTWHHIAFVRSSNTLKMYLDGIEVGSSSLSTNFTQSHLTIGKDAASGGTSLFNGYIYSYRLVKGTAVYTSEFTPPTAALTAITNTKLLLRGPGKFDESSSNHIITVNGDASTQPWAPFDYTGYSASTHGGSAYFVGSDDKLSYADNADWDLTPGDWTIEFWIYKQDTGTYQNLFGQRNSSSSEFRVVTDFPNNNAGGLNFQYGSASISFDADVANGVWQHHAWVEHSGDVKCYVDGVLKYTNTNSVSVNYSAPFIIGGWGSATYAFKGYMTDFRLVKGTAVYTGDFTPPNGRLTTTGGEYPSTTNVNTSITAGHTKLLLPMVDRKVYDISQSLYDGSVAGSAVASSGQTHFSENTIYIPNGDTDYIEIPANNAHLIYESDYTVEAWLYPTSFSSANNNYFVSKGNPAASATNREWGFSATAGALKAYWSTNGAASGDAAVTGSVTNNLNEWTHVAFTKNGNTISIFKDGTYINNGAFTSIYNTVNGATTVGRLWGYTGISHSYNGYIHDLRITKGKSRYPFAPEFKELTTTNSVASGTTVTESNVRVVGVYNSSSASTMTGTAASDITVALGSGTSVSTFAPYTGGGSIYMDGGAGPTTYASFTNSSQDGLFNFAGSDDFGIEYYFYHNEDIVSNTSRRHLNCNATGGLGFFKSGSGDPGGANKLVIRRKGQANDLAVDDYLLHFPNYKWNHVCVQRVSGTLEVFGNGTLLASATSNTNSYPNGVVGFGSVNTTSDNFNGYFSNLRVVKGQGIYSRNFTAPASALSG